MSNLTSYRDIPVSAPKCAVCGVKERTSETMCDDCYELGRKMVAQTAAPQDDILVRGSLGSDWK
jgi:hypothetical protein